jgi:hypothetical protein
MSASHLTDHICIHVALVSHRGEIAGILFNAGRAYRFFCDPVFNTTFAVMREIVVENDIPYWCDAGVEEAKISFDGDISSMRRQGWQPFDLENRTVMMWKFKELFFMAKLADNVHGPFPWIGL